MSNHGRMLLIAFWQLSLAESCQQLRNGTAHYCPADSQFQTSSSSIFLITSSRPARAHFPLQKLFMLQTSDDTRGKKMQKLAKDGQDLTITSISKETANKYKISHLYAVRKVTRLSTLVLDKHRLLPFPNLSFIVLSLPAVKEKKLCQLCTLSWSGHKTKLSRQFLL